MLAVLAFLLVWALISELDRRGSRRFVWDQYRNHRYLSSPVNLAILAATPRAVRGSPIVPITRETFANVDALRSAFSVIRAEALSAYSASKPIQNDQFFTTIADKGWKRFYLKWYSAACDPLALQLCPQTCALVQSMPNVHLAMFSILEPGSRIKPHSGLFRGCYRYHLGLSTPNSDACFINIGGQRYSWRDGEDVLFDDTFTHFVANNTQERRIVLFLDVERPLSAPSVRALNAAFIRHIAPLSTRANDRQEAASLVR